MDTGSKIYIAGHQGMVGSAIWRALKIQGYNNLLGRSIGELDLIDQGVVDSFFAQERPEYVFLAAAKVGGIQANDRYRGEFIYVNLAIQNNVIHSAYKFGVKKLLFLGSSCIYPRECPQPIKEEYLLTGPLETTNEPYAIAKIAGLKLCESYNRQFGTDFIAAMPTNLYGPNDNYDLETSHVLPALVRKFVEAKQNANPCVTVWGSGKVKREFLHVDDAADACVYLMKNVSAADLNRFGEGSANHLCFVNVGTGEDVSIAELACMIKDAVDYDGDISFDHSKPDGTRRKLLDVCHLASLGWCRKIPLNDGIKRTVECYKNGSGRI
ncbi:MAG: GDP-L-fucose synthase [Pseudomonadota bacterium]